MKMQANKLTYHQGEAVANSPLFIEKGLEKTDFAAKKRINYYPYGKVLRMLQFDRQRHLLQGNQHDNETGLEYFNARNLESDLVFFRSIDPRPNNSFSVYASMQGNPIKYNDPLGDTVRYASFKDRVNVGLSRLRSKAFRQEFRALKNDVDVFTYRDNEISAANSNAGGVYLKKVNANNKEFDLTYSTKDADRFAPVGKGRLHGLFEETFHASDYLKTKNGVSGGSNIEIISVYGVKSLGWRTKSDKRLGESMAWKFAADNNFTGRSRGYFTRTTGGVDSETTISQIRNAQTLKDVENLLFKPHTIQYTIPFGGQGVGTMTIGPIYN
jgi:RHS repeat-associated protein